MMHIQGKDVHGFFYAAFHTSQPATVDCVQRYLQKYIKENKLNINFYPFTMGETYDRYVIEGFTSLWELSNDVIGKMIREASAKGLAFHQWSMTLSSNMSFDRHMPVPCEIDKQFQHLRNALVATQTQRLSKDSTHMLEEQKAVLQTQIRFMVQRISHLEDCMRQKDERITILTEENDSLIDDVSSLNKDIKEMKGVIVKVQGYFKTFSTSMLASGL